MNLMYENNNKLHNIIIYMIILILFVFQHWGNTNNPYTQSAVENSLTLCYSLLYPAQKFYLVRPSLLVFIRSKISFTIDIQYTCRVDWFMLSPIALFCLSHYPPSSHRSPFCARINSTNSFIPHTFLLTYVFNIVSYTNFKIISHPTQTTTKKNIPVYHSKKKLFGF